MPKEASGSPLTNADVTRLKQTATDSAVNDMDYAGSATAESKCQLTDLVRHFQEEGGEQLKGIASMSRSFITKRPLLCVGAALAIGILIGASGCSRSRK